MAGGRSFANRPFRVPRVKGVLSRHLPVIFHASLSFPRAIKAKHAKKTMPTDVSDASPLFTPTTLADLPLKNRIIYPFVRRLQIWWIKLQGDIMNRKLTRGFNLMTKLSNDAEVGGVQHSAQNVHDATIADLRPQL